jgi:cytochrome c
MTLRSLRAEWTRRVTCALVAATAAGAMSWALAEGATAANPGDEAVDYPAAFEPCTTCHVYHKGEAPEEGAPLWGVYGRKIASVEGFEYSDGLKALGERWSTWDDAKLEEFLASPKTVAPGTKMKFGGAKTPEARAEVIKFLKTLHD